MGFQFCLRSTPRNALDSTRYSKSSLRNLRGKRLWSGLARLIFIISYRLASKFQTKQEDLLEYVLNQPDLWEDARLSAKENEDEEEDTEDGLEAQLANLDVALFSLIEPLDMDVSAVATTLDDVLSNSLWRRTLNRQKEPVQELEREMLRSRAEWLWRSSSAEQRKACFYSGLGRKPGVFLHDQIDALVEDLVAFQNAVSADDGDAAAGAAVSFHEKVIQEPFFGVRRLPEKHEDVLAEWVKGTAFAEILEGRSVKDGQRAQIFVQEGVIFRLVWAAEAVRVQAISMGHTRAGELGDGPAFALTYGVSSIPAALLCQIGFSSRVGAMWAVRALSAQFTDMNGLRLWLRQNNALLSDPDFWESEDLFRLWNQVSAPTNVELPRLWTHSNYTVPVEWKLKKSPVATTQVRIIPGNDRTGTICATDLTPLGVAQFGFDPHGAALDGSVKADGTIQVSYFGRG
jgi:hypothetical protein